MNATCTFLCGGMEHVNNVCVWEIPSTPCMVVVECGYVLLDINCRESVARKLL